VFSASGLNSLRFGLNREGVQDNLTAQALNPAAADLSAEKLRLLAITISNWTSLRR
jgi:hypothetical protein